ncbi:thymidylate synthase [Platysternon megacephalum]|uniref:Thymidylate synthase n=1 Tax=Platysternon megacephalum TaxID=55544 RepID=A0A4D9DD39_9SAUR|nr:thymidylate synthase [Platysternon megacephalum]
MDLGLHGRSIIVTGASSGLGKATAAVLAAEGAHLTLCSRNADKLRAAAANMGGTHHLVTGDLADPALAERLIGEATERFGAVHGAVLSVGGPPVGRVEDLTDDAWRSAFDSVFLGPLRVARAIIAAAQTGTAITFVLSTSVTTPVEGLGLSNGLRPGLAMAAKSLADECGPRGIRVNCLLPHRIDTDRIREIENATGDAAAAREAALASIPLRRIGTPEEFGTMAAFVTSPAASYLTGTAIPVDGGARRIV